MPFTTPVRSYLDNSALLLALTPVIALLTHYMAVLPHEFGHSFMAWGLGLKTTPFDIDWGGSSLANILLLIHIDENVDYSLAFAAGLNWQVALVAFAGPGLANGGMYLASRWAMGRLRALPPLVAYSLLWFVLMNLANLYDYVPLRTFATSGDVEHFSRATGVSPWTIYVVGGYVVLIAIIDFYRKALLAGMSASGILRPAPRGLVIVLATLLLFAYFAIPSFLASDPISRFMAGTSVMAIPVVLWAMLVRRSWQSPTHDDR